MTIDDVLADMDARFRSGNAVSVERAYITREQWEIVSTALAIAADDRLQSISLEVRSHA